MRRSTVNWSIFALAAIMVAGYVVVEILHWLEKRQRR